ncbi:hypothetical protein ESCAB7627_3761 [Escherichia albertii TW07627]|uniref:Uncharacterized protein n=1 Tax=Escherichia albertii (strain TW07627) TaxID=502347 RepID=A0ABC9NL41_ESCAT|nr:hypothetical protein ESCAB7627_3761 [Escherichia albertii TW07627]
MTCDDNVTLVNNALSLIFAPVVLFFGELVRVRHIFFRFFDYRQIACAMGSHFE